MKTYKDSHLMISNMSSQRPSQQYLKLADVTTQHGLENQPSISVANNENLSIGIITEY